MDNVPIHRPPARAAGVMHGPLAMTSITYEQPLNERIRMLLRLEFLFLQIDHTLERESPWDSRATLASLIEVLNVFARGDLKPEVMKELERLAANLSPLEDKPGVDRGKLGQILDNMDLLIDQLHGLQGQPGQDLKDNEFISAIKQRSGIPGGTCDFDLPAFHYWLEQPAERRIADLRQWLSAFDSMRAATDLILRLVRESADSRRITASGGFHQQSLDTSSPFQLIRVTLPQDSPYYAEISGGKHRFTVRFMELSYYERPAQTDRDVEFGLACCAI